MAQFRTSADIIDSILLRAGEPTGGTSAFESRALEFLNRIHHVIIGGGNEFNIECNEVWPWAKASAPMVLELQPKYNTGTVSLTNGSEAGSFSSAVTDSKAKWYLQLNGRAGLFRLASHAAGATAFELDGAYDGETGATLNYKLFKLDYELAPSYITINSKNNKLDFEETASSELTATLTNGSYTPGDLATEIDTQLTSAGASAYTITYDSDTRKFTLASDRAGGGNTFKLLCASGTNAKKAAWETLGFDIEDQADAASHESSYILGGVSRLIEPAKIYKGAAKEGNIYGTDAARFHRDYPLVKVEEGYPTRFAKIIEDAEGAITVRFNKYPEEVTRIEFDFIPVPIDIKDNAVSVPKVPRKFIDILEYGASAFLLLEKEDSKWETFHQLAGSKLEAAIGAHRHEIQKTGEHFAQTVARQDLLDEPRRLIYGTPEST